MADHSTGTSGTLRQSSISETLIQDALSRYLDENKPDPLMKKQMESWDLQWEDDVTPPAMHADATESAPEEEQKPLNFQPSDVIAGNLYWTGEYMRIVLRIKCYWQGSKEGSLFFSCSASGQVLEQAQLDATISGASGGGRKEDKASAKVQKSMLKRLRKDDYISKYLLIPERGKVQERATATATATSPRPFPNTDASMSELCEARIDFREDRLEERVHCAEDVAEAIRRAIFSTADATIDVFDWIVNLPILPCTSHSNSTCSSGSGDNKKRKKPYFVSTALANRAKLRILEDVMCDACEQEGEEEIVDSLELGGGKRSKH